MWSFRERFQPFRLASGYLWLGKGIRLRTVVQVAEARLNSRRLAPTWLGEASKGPPTASKSMAELADAREVLAARSQRRRRAPRRHLVVAFPAFRELTVALRLQKAEVRWVTNHFRLASAPQVGCSQLPGGSRALGSLPAQGPYHLLRPERPKAQSAFEEALKTMRNWLLRQEIEVEHVEIGCETM